MRLRSIRIATTVPLFALGALAWWADYAALAVLCALGGVLLAILQWMTMRALQYNAPADPPRSGGSLADRERGPL